MWNEQVEMNKKSMSKVKIWGQKDKNRKNKVKNNKIKMMTEKMSIKEKRMS